jgi:hypothetical protein
MDALPVIVVGLVVAALPLLVYGVSGTSRRDFLKGLFRGSAIGDKTLRTPASGHARPCADGARHVRLGLSGDSDEMAEP